ncbi:hypothetical protein ED825_23075 [Escherichia coli]|nr:hypothetical protein [Escherichia coli]EFO2289685.1 hypothetical protein [Escherichia coli O148]KOQ77218.1 hypothetical protein ABW46_22040 [Enterobacter hormaechei]POV09434.1 hypothetical protein C3371_23845 [Enterobacter cloacae complex sp. ECNIH13]POV59629.1 hypothetical protein C3390_24155 [Enterobacter cloacae complex sp. ECNIH15]
MRLHGYAVRFILKEADHADVGYVRFWHKADTHSNIQKSMTYLLYKLCPSIANNQTVDPEAALVEITACSDPL